MFFKLREEGKQPIGARKFWICVAAAVLLVSGIGVFTIRTRIDPQLSVRATEFLLAGMWALMLFQIIRARRFFPWTQGKVLVRLLPWPQLAILVGTTLMLSGTAWPRSFLAASWVQGVASLMFVAGILPQIFEFRRGTVPSSNSANV